MVPHRAVRTSLLMDADGASQARHHEFELRCSHTTHFS
jgi:hypothetical protein